MGGVVLGIIFGGVALILFWAGAAFLGSESELETTGHIGIGFLVGAFVAGIIAAVMFKE